MELSVQIIKGPRTAKVNRAAAEAQLKAHPAFPKNASAELEEVDGRWVAAIATPKVAAPPFGGPPAEESGPPAPDGPPSDEAPEPELPEEPKEEKSDDDKPKGEDKGEGKKGLEGEVAHLTELVTKLVDALGLGGPDLGPGADGEAGPTPPPPHGAPGDSDPSVPGKQAPDGKTHTVHERALKPGEAAPGTTPVGAPSFASVNDDHPWAEELRSGVKAWRVEEEIGPDESMTAIASELNELAKPVGCRVEQLRPLELDGKRVASARIVRE